MLSVIKNKYSTKYVLSSTNISSCVKRFKPYPNYIFPHPYNNCTQPITEVFPTHPQIMIWILICYVGQSGW